MPVYKDIHYRLTKSKRKTASIYIERDGSISVLVPSYLSQPEIDHLIESKRKWIYRQLAEWQDLNATRIVRDYLNGEGFLYLGRSYRLKLVRNQDSPLVLMKGYFCLSTKRDGTIQGDPKQIFRDFYRDRGQLKIPERIGRFEASMGVEAKGVKVMDLKNRWASCSAKGVLNFHWKCMMAPLKILDYLVVHELVHLMHPHHTQDFWNEVDKILPDYRERQGWLKQNGAGMGL